MKKTFARFTDWVYKLTASTGFFIFTLVLMGIQGAWMAMTAIYPLPFDEYVHVGLVQIYAKQWSPFITVQPAYASIYGDITREPSYLYHYLMSFPYRFVDLFTNSQMALIISMRLLNVTFVIGGMIFFRKLLQSWGVSGRIINLALLAFASTLIIPFLAAHVNYDNMMFLLAPVFLLMATKLIADNQNLLRHMLLFLVMGILTVLVKRTFLPLACITGMYVAIVLLYRNGLGIFKEIAASWKHTRKGLSFWLICLALLAVLGLFAERYGGNVVIYGSIWPHCHKVQPVSVCAEYGPWHRDYVQIQTSRPATPPFGNPFSFSQYWVTTTMTGFYGIFGHYYGARPSQGDPYGGIGWETWLPQSRAMGYICLVLGLVALAWQWRRILHHRYLLFGLIICFGYLAAIWVFNYLDYLRLWRAVAVQARYSYPVLIILFALMIQAGSWTIKSRQLKAALLMVFIATYVWGGGIAGWIIRAHDDWRWQNSVIQTSNNAARDVLSHIIIN